MAFRELPTLLEIYDIAGSFCGWPLDKDGNTLYNVLLFNDIDEAIKSSSKFSRELISHTIEFDKCGPLKSAKIIILSFRK